MCSKLFKINVQCIMCSNHYWFKFLWSVLLLCYYGLRPVQDSNTAKIQTWHEKSYPRTKEKKVHKRWRNRSFLLSSSDTTLILTTTHGWEYICGKPEVQRKGSSILLAQFLSTDSLKKEEVSFHLGHFSCNMAQLSVKTDRLQPGTSPTGEKDSTVSAHFASPAVQHAAQKDHFFLAPERILRWSEQVRSWEQLGSQQPGPGTQQSSEDLSNLCLDSIRKHVHEGDLRTDYHDQT